MACLLTRPRDVDEMTLFCLALCLSCLLMPLIVCHECGNVTQEFNPSLHSFSVFSGKQLLDQCLILKYHPSASLLQVLLCIPPGCQKFCHKRAEANSVRSSLKDDLAARDRVALSPRLCSQRRLIE